MKRLIIHLLHRLGIFRPERITFDLEFEDRLALRELARREERRSDDVAAELLAGAIERRRADGELLQTWRSLSPREQEVAALICLGYTTRIIAQRLALTPQTVNMHARNALRKFGLRRRAELQRLLEAWDFGSWASER